MSNTNIRGNLPPKDNTSSADKTKKYFNTFYDKQLSYPSNEVDAVIGFLESKGFDFQAARSTGAILLQQAKIDSVPSQKILDQLGKSSPAQLSELITVVLNSNRYKTSRLGFRSSRVSKEFTSRNIID